MESTPEHDIEQSLQALKDIYAELFVLMEQVQAQSLEPRHEHQAMLRQNAEVARRMQVADGALRAFIAQIGHWPELRRQLDPRLRDDVARFLDTLEQGLAGMKTRLHGHLQVLLKEQQDVAASIREIHKNRLGMRGYRQGAKDASLFDSKA